MRSFARPFMVLMAMALFQAPAVAQIDMNPNIQNLPENLNLQDLELTTGQHLLTIQVPLYARDLHQDIESIEIACGAHKGDDNEFIAGGWTEVPYRGRTLRTTVSVPLEFPEGEDGNITQAEGYRCYAGLNAPDTRWTVPHSESSDLRFLLDEASTNPPIVEGSLGQVEIPVPF